MDNNVVCAISRLMNEIIEKTRSLNEDIESFIYDKRRLDAEIAKLNNYIQENIHVTRPQKTEI